jgi:hypothetical protein
MKLTRLLALALCAALMSFGAAGASAEEGDRPIRIEGQKEGERDVPRDVKRESDAPREVKRESDAPRDVKRESDAPRDVKRESDSPRDGQREGQPEGGLPEAVFGFNGNVRAVVVEKGLENNAFIKVNAINKVWEGANKAKAPRLLVGKTIEIRPMPAAHGEGEARGNEQREIQAAFINKLRPKLDGNLNIRHAEGNVFFITELTPDQRVLAIGERAFEGREGGHKEGERRIINPERK